MKGIYERMQEEVNYIKVDINKYKKMSTAEFLDELEATFQSLIEQDRLRDKRLELPAFGYEGFSDDQFRSIATDPGIKFIGGREGCEAFINRCIKLGII